MEELVQGVNSKQIIGVLEQIQKTNYMVDLHRLHGENSMVKQFERQREAFLEQLRVLLRELSIQAELKAVAA